MGLISPEKGHNMKSVKDNMESVNKFDQIMKQQGDLARRARKKEVVGDTDRLADEGSGLNVAQGKKLRLRKNRMNKL